MSEEKRKEKGKKTAITNKKRGNFAGDNNPLSKKKYGIDQIIKKNKKSHATAKKRGTDKIRIANSVKTKHKNGIYKIASAKAAKTTRDSGILKGKNHPRAKKYKLISPTNEIIYINGNFVSICQQYKLSKRVLRENINNGKIILKSKNCSSILTYNTVGWEIIEE